MTWSEISFIHWKCIGIAVNPEIRHMLRNQLAATHNGVRVSSVWFAVGVKRQSVGVCEAEIVFRAGQIKVVGSWMTGTSLEMNEIFSTGLTSCRKNSPWIHPHRNANYLNEHLPNWNRTFQTGYLVRSPELAPQHSRCLLRQRFDGNHSHWHLLAMRIHRNGGNSWNSWGDRLHLPIEGIDAFVCSNENNVNEFAVMMGK